jgi:ADP-heptose:LPS heptosyltransferase
MPLPNSDCSPSKILIVRFSHLGDVVSALPLYYGLRSAFPAARIAWATQTEYAPLLESLPGLERIISLDRRGGLHGIKRLWDELRAFGPDLTVDPQANFKSAATALFSGASRRVGPHARDWREAAARHLVTEHAAPALGPHNCDRVTALTQYITKSPVTRRDPNVSTAELSAARASLQRHIPGEEPFLLVHLSRPKDPRSWPEERYLELAQLAAARALPTLFLSGPSEAALGERLAASSHGVYHWVGQRGLRELAALFTAAANRGAHLLACDSGPMHLAAACDLGVTLLAGPQDERATGPEAWGKIHAALRSTLQPACAPCKLRTCHHPRGPICMSEITAQRAMDAVAPRIKGVTPCA